MPSSPCKSDLSKSTLALSPGVWSTGANPCTPGSDMSGVLDADSMMVTTPDRPTRGGLGSSPMVDPATPEAPKRPALHRAKALSPASFGKALAAVGSSSTSGTPSPKSKVRAMLQTPKSVNKSSSSSSSGKKTNITPKPKMVAKGVGSKSKTVAKKAMKTMKKMPMKGVRKFGLKQAKKGVKAMKTMKSMKSMKVAKTPKSKSRIQALPEPSQMIAIKEFDSRDAEGNVNFWSKDNPDKIREVLTEAYEDWRDVYDYGSTYIIGGIRLESDPWPVWACGALEEAGWVLHSNKGRHQRWELGEEDDS